MLNEQLPKRESPVERVIGPGFDAEDYEIALEYLRRRFKIQDFEGLRGIEREKTEEEKEILNWVNNETNELIEAYGARSVDIPQKNIHIIPEEQWLKTTNMDNSAAFYNFSTQAILYRDASSKSLLAYRAFHEMMHIKFHQTAQYAEEKGKKGFTTYRSGLGLSSEKREDSAIQFRKINEAIVETLAINFWNEKISKDGRFADEAIKIERAKNVLREEKLEIQFDELAAVTQKEPDGNPQFLYFSYPDERAALGHLINALYKSNREKFKTPGEIFDLFVRSSITGHMVELAKLIDRTRGTGAFKRLGEMSSEKHTAEELYSYVETF